MPFVSTALARSGSTRAWLALTAALAASPLALTTSAHAQEAPGDDAVTSAPDSTTQAPTQAPTTQASIPPAPTDSTATRPPHSLTPIPARDLAAPPSGPPDDHARSMLVVELVGRLGGGGVALGTPGAYERNLGDFPGTFTAGVAVTGRLRGAGFGVSLGAQITTPNFGFRLGALDLRLSERLTLFQTQRQNVEFSLLVEAGLSYAHGSGGERCDAYPLESCVHASSFDTLGPVVAVGPALRAGTFLIGAELEYHYGRTLSRPADAPDELDEIRGMVRIGASLPVLP